MTSANAQKLNSVLRNLGEEYTFTGKVNINGMERFIFKNKVKQSYIKIDAQGRIRVNDEIQ